MVSVISAPLIKILFIPLPNSIPRFSFGQVTVKPMVINTLLLTLHPLEEGLDGGGGGGVYKCQLSLKISAIYKFQILGQLPRVS